MLTPAPDLTALPAACARKLPCAVSLTPYSAVSGSAAPSSTLLLASVLGGGETAAGLFSAGQVFNDAALIWGELSEHTHSLLARSPKPFSMLCLWLCRLAV